MTGEMSWVKPNGEAADGNTYAVHAVVARALRCRLRPFDAYIGPYVQTKRGKLFISTEDGAGGTVCLWPDGQPPSMREPITADYFPFDDSVAALAAARDVLKRARKGA